MSQDVAPGIDYASNNLETDFPTAGPSTKLPRVNTVAFPSKSTAMSSAGTGGTDLSLVRQAAAMDVYDFVYGESSGEERALQQIDRFYEANAGIYENAFITASSRSVIADIFMLTRRLRQLDMPSPLAAILALLRIKPPEFLFGPPDSTGHLSYHPWFQIARAWTEVEDLVESESFDGHRRTYIEHTLNILLLPGLHHASAPANSTPALPPSSSSLSLHNLPSPPQPSLLFSIPSPLHIKMHILTRLSFNEAGRITNHRDFWDVKDVIGLVPGVSLMQWITSRTIGQTLSFASRLFARPRREVRSRAERYGVREEELRDLVDRDAMPGPAPVESDADSEQEQLTVKPHRRKKSSSVSRSSSSRIPSQTPASQYKSAARNQLGMTSSSTKLSTSGKSPRPR